MNHSRKLLKRAIAITTAASFVTVGGNTALAAGSYREAETAAYDNFVGGTASLWRLSGKLSESADGFQGSDRPEAGRYGKASAWKCGRRNGFVLA